MSSRLLTAVALTSILIGVSHAQREPEKPAVGRFKLIEPLGRKTLFDTGTGECWLYVPDEWVPYSGPLPWKVEKPLVGRFEFNPYWPSNCILDTATGKCWQFTHEYDDDGKPAIRRGAVQVRWSEIKKKTPMKP
jgi:hypothetical protein